MKRTFFNKEMLRVSVMTLVTVLVWVGFDVYRALHKETPVKVTASQMAPLNPELNKKTIESLKGNVSFSEEELNRQISSESAILEE